jgi:hypothetical protein
VRLLVKSGSLVDAARLADSLLTSTLTGRPESALMLAGVAALTGRAFVAARWARAGSDSMVSNPLAPGQFLPLPPLREASALLAYAAAGDMADSVRALAQRVDAMIARAVALAQRLTIRRTLMDWPLTLAWPDLGPSPLHRASAEGNVHMEAEWALAHADSSRARAKLAQLEQQGLMTDCGREKIEEARQAGTWDAPPPQKIADEQVEAFVALVRGAQPAYTNLMNMAQSARRNYTGLYFSAKSEETRARRLQQIIDRLNRNLKPMESGK